MQFFMGKNLAQEVIHLLAGPGIKKVVWNILLWGEIIVLTKSYPAVNTVSNINLQQKRFSSPKNFYKSFCVQGNISVTIHFSISAINLAEFWMPAKALLSAYFNSALLCSIEKVIENHQPPCIFFLFISWRNTSFLVYWWKPTDFYVKTRFRISCREFIRQST